MATPAVLDIESLAQPLSDDQPAGMDLREDASASAVYYEIKDARSAARAAERAAETDAIETGQVVPEWHTLLSLVPTVLTERTKDLEITAWLIEALVRVHGFAGLRDGYGLVTELTKRYWDDLYPRPEDDSLEDRVAALTGLNGEGGEGALIAPLRKVALTEGSEESFALWHFEQASALAKETSEEKREARIAQGAVTMERFDKSVRETSASFFVSLLDDLTSAKEAFAAATAALDSAAGSQSPPSANIREILDSVESTIRFIARDKLESAAAAAEAAAESADAEGGDPSAAGTAAPTGSRGITTREDAFRELVRIAEFFRKSEPHSPLSYTLDDLVRRGRMSLPELLTELIPDSQTRSMFLLSAGIKPPAEDGE